VIETCTNRPVGSLVASVLAGAWRHFPPDVCSSTEELATVSSLLLGSSAGALTWWKLRHSELKKTEPGFELQEAYRFHAIRTLVRQHTIKQVLELLSSAGIEPILVKGWAIARLYPEPGLRPYGDIDLVVRPEQYATAVEVTKGGEINIDVHCGFRGLDNRNFDELRKHSRIVKLDDVNVRVLSPEDHLRVLCLHMLRHNVFRPLWLCDIAVAVETRAPDFNWDISLAGDRRRADWVACSLGLAHQLLGAEIDDTPVARRAKSLPGWLISNVLKQWETPYGMVQAPMTHAAPMAKYLRDPRGLLKDLRRRWPHPIEATVYVRGPFNELPRFPFQIGECIGRAARFVAQLPKSLRERDGFD
jgi:hypothetical protein